MPTATTLVRPPRPRHNPAPPNVLYGYAYNPNWPSILSIAHDETDGGALFVITDRPCTLGGIATVLPLSLPDAPGLVIVQASGILPVKFRLSLSGAVPRGTPWTWGDGACDLSGIVSGHIPNAGAGSCADIPGPYTPLPPAGVVQASAYGSYCTLAFDQPIALNGDPVDGAILFDGQPATGVTQPDPHSLQFATSTYVTSGSTWSVVSQPAWIVGALTWPADGVF